MDLLIVRVEQALIDFNCALGQFQLGVAFVVRGEFLQLRGRNGGGLLIEDVRNNAARVDLRPGDVILALIARGESIEIKTLEQFNRLLAQLDKAANVTLLVRRGELQTFVTIKGLADK